LANFIIQYTGNSHTYLKTIINRTSGPPPPIPRPGFTIISNHDSEYINDIKSIHSSDITNDKLIFSSHMMTKKILGYYFIRYLIKFIRLGNYICCSKSKVQTGIVHGKFWKWDVSVKTGKTV
jgi:hypothetical protein